MPYTSFSGSRADDAASQAPGGAGWTAYGYDGDDLLFGGEAGDVIQGGRDDDLIVGGAGDDVLDGDGWLYLHFDDGSYKASYGSGADNLYGGGGNDLLAGGAGDDRLYGGDDDDTLHDAAFVLAVDISGTYIEQMSPTIVGQVGQHPGFSSRDILSGGAGNDTIHSVHGADQIVGGAGRDTLHLSRFFDIEGEPDDTDYVVDISDGGGARDIGGGTTVEEIEILDATMGGGDDGLIGADLADTLRGGGGDDWLDGGRDGDVLEGGDGDDTYVVDTSRDVIQGEAVDSGVDTVRASLDWTLAAHLENLTLTGTADLRGDGNALDNILIGNDGANVLDGKAGADVMSGGLGSNTYYVDNIGDRVIGARAGFDRIFASADFNAALSPGQVEEIVLTGGALSATGDGFANTLIGNVLANTLNGYKGADVMEGRVGNDIYIVDNVGDRTTERAGEGTDTVRSSISWTLADHVENLTLGGSAALNGTGNREINTIVGNSGANVIAGLGGADTLSGGLGADTFLYLDALDATTALYDRIKDFGVGDRIDLTAVDANSALAGDQDFVLVDRFSRVAGQMTVSWDATKGFTSLLGDLDGDARADFRIVLTGDHAAALKTDGTILGLDV